MTQSTMIESSLPIETWADNDSGLITRVQVVTGKYMQKFTAVGSITVWYNGIPSESRGMCRNLTHPQKHLIDLKPDETIVSMKVFSNLTHRFVSGLSVTTNKKRTFGPFGLASRVVQEVKSPYQNGYYVSSLAGSSGDVLMDLRANFACTYQSPFVRDSKQNSLANSTTSTISSRGSAGSGYHTDEDFLNSSTKPLLSETQYQNKFHSELENRLQAVVEQPALTLNDLNSTTASRTSTKSRTKPLPPPRSDLKAMITSQNSQVPRKLSRNGSKGSLLMRRPILAKTTNLSTC